MSESSVRKGTQEKECKLQLCNQIYWVMGPRPEHCSARISKQTMQTGSIKKEICLYEATSDNVIR